MHVIKRDGRRVEVAFDKITARIKKLSYGLHPEHCDRYVCANKNVFVFFLLLLLYLLGSVVYSKNEGWWRLTRRVLCRHEACARGLPSFKTFWRHSLLDSRLFQPRLFPNWRDIWRRYNNHERIEEAYGSFFFYFESSARFQRAERRWNVSYPRFFSSYARKHVYGGFVHVSWTFLVREMTCERRIRNLHFQKSQRANSSLFDDASRVSKRLKKWEKRVVTDQILLSFTLK